MLERDCLEESNLGRFDAPSVVIPKTRLEKGIFSKENQIFGGQCAREREKACVNKSNVGWTTLRARWIFIQSFFFLMCLIYSFILPRKVDMSVP